MGANEGWRDVDWFVLGVAIEVTIDELAMSIAFGIAIDAGIEADWP